jgi:DNA-binding Xre family transcriptional regulator
MGQIVVVALYGLRYSAARTGARMTYLRVKELAEQQGFTMTTLSRKAELSYTTVHALWHDKLSKVAMTTLERVAVTLGVRVSDLFGGEPELQLDAPHVVLDTEATASIHSE